MDLSLTDDQRQLGDVLSSFLAKESPLDLVRAAEPLGFDDSLWAKLGELGVVVMGLPGSLGGDDGSLLDITLAAERIGAVLAPVPFVDTVVAARLLARLHAPDAVLAPLVGGAPATIGLHPAVDGRLRLVPSGAVAEVVVGLDGDDLVAVTIPGPQIAPVNIACAPIADRELRVSDRVILASGGKARTAHASSVDEWRVLTAAALTGLAAQALQLAVEHAKTREQFGVPIGTFQALAHRLADAAIGVTGSRLLSWEAAWSAAEDPQRFPALAAMAYAFASEVAEQVTYDSVHVHGGVGFSLEGDCQLFFRRAKGWTLALGGVQRGYCDIADRVLGPVGG
jgi:alkylation response protein AidB-like acyl-CoA dehydrogenase